jgi:hypothetical protein
VILFFIYSALSLRKAPASAVIADADTSEAKTTWRSPSADGMMIPSRRAMFPTVRDVALDAAGSEKADKKFDVNVVDVSVYLL